MNSSQITVSVDDIRMVDQTAARVIEMLLESIMRRKTAGSVAFPGYCVKPSGPRATFNFLLRSA